MPFGGDPARNVTTVVAALLVMTYGSSRRIRALVLPAAVAWFAVTVGWPEGYSAYGWIVLACAAGSLLLFAIEWAECHPPLNRVDVVVNSASGNTMHLTRGFVAGLEAGGSAVTVHRFHHFRDFRAELNGDGLVVAFPVYGFKPPWPMLVWLVRRLPRGDGRPAFVL